MDDVKPLFLTILDGTELIYYPCLDRHYKDDCVYHKFKTGDTRKCPSCKGNRTFRPYPWRVSIDGKNDPFFVGFWTLCQCEADKYQKHMRSNVRYY